MSFRLERQLINLTFVGDVSDLCLAAGYITYAEADKNQLQIGRWHRDNADLRVRVQMPPPSPPRI